VIQFDLNENYEKVISVRSMMLTQDWREMMLKQFSRI